MNNGSKAGFAIFVVGLILLLGYGFFQGIQEISLESLDTIGIILFVITIIGLIILFISILAEQQEGKKKMKEEIKKEDLEP